MIRCRMIAVVLCTVALAVGCGQNSPPADAGPSLADQLAAAQELAVIAEDRYVEAVSRGEEVRELRNRAVELESPETVEKAERTLEKLNAAVEEARVARDAARNKVRLLANQLLQD